MIIYVVYANKPPMLHFVFPIFVLLLPNITLASDCVQNSGAVMNVHSVHANPVYDFSTGAEAIQSIADDVMHRVRSGWVLGFTQYQPVLSMDAPIDSVPDVRGGFCARITRLDIAVGFGQEIVYVPREIVGAVCGLEEVMMHERRHLALNRAITTKYMRIIHKEFSDHLATRTTDLWPSAEQARAEAHKNMRTVFDSIAAAMNADIISGQNEIDSADEYDRLMHICGGELANVVRDVREQRFAFRDGRF